MNRANPDGEQSQLLRPKAIRFGSGVQFTAGREDDLVQTHGAKVRL